MELLVCFGIVLWLGFIKWWFRVDYLALYDLPNASKLIGILQSTKRNVKVKNFYLNSYGEFKIKQNFKVVKNCKNKCYLLKNAINFENYIQKCRKCYENKLNNNLKLKAIDNVFLIEFIANCCAKEITKNINFDAFGYVNNLKLVKFISKNELKIFPYFLAKSLVSWLVVLEGEALSAQNEVLRGKHNKVNLKSGLSIYGASLSENARVKLKTLTLAKIKKAQFDSLRYFECLNKQINNLNMWAKFLLENKIIKA